MRALETDCPIAEPIHRGWIPLNTGRVAHCGHREARTRIQRFLGSVRVEFTETTDAVRILGPDTRYHDNDPFLLRAVSDYRNGMRAQDIGGFKEHRRIFDLCFEDVWTGYFIADFYRGAATPDDLILIHLDDHTDMMATLLTRSEARLEDPTTAGPFDPSVPESWEAAYLSGSVGIGNFVTALYHLPCRLHVRHLNNFERSRYACYGVTHGSRCHSLIPGVQFAAIRKTTKVSANGVGTYLGGTDPNRVLAGLPDGNVMIHVDLDYFINDFNGNPVAEVGLPCATLTDVARSKLDDFFAAIRPLSSRIDRWIVATSPGFCSAFHWPWLLEQLEHRIEDLGEPDRPSG